MIDFENLSEGELYEIGKKLGVLSQKRPDISHRLILGFRDGLELWGKHEFLGDIFWMLWRQGNHYCPKESLVIQFASLLPRPSGVGSNK